ncbi:Outer membrane protein and related peptidoglycan-associated (lipo)protein-like protein [Flavobacteriales bacterium ALC-1]|nr:Outer membrane protein and related peptidoglycan-associated (lipo)protein-like protein [Flavobacteriales bacterium ALC-1]
MNQSTVLKQLFITTFLVLFVSPSLEAQTKKLKRPKNKVGISSVDKFVKESFDLYEKVYKYDSYAEAGTPLEDEDIDVLEDALENVSALSESAPDIVDDLSGKSVFKQGKATLQINRAKKALKYSIKTAKKLLLGAKKGEEDEDDDNSSSDDKDTGADKNSEDISNRGSNENQDNTTKEEPSNISDGLEVYSKYDFVPGDKLIFYDDFTNDFIGDFPSKWNTNGSGEVVTLNKVQGRWLEFKQGYNTFFIPSLPRELPENFTIEFDLVALGINDKTSSAALLEVKLEDNNEFRTGKDFARVEIPFVQYVTSTFRVRNRINGKNSITNNVKADIRKAVLNKPHISIAVNKERLRVWVNEKKCVDIPKMIGTNSPLKAIKFHMSGFKEEGKERLFISNLKISEGGEDLRRKLMSEGKISTNGILFDSGSANIQPQSLGIVRQISQVLMQDESIKLNIIGHTDADGPDDANLKLSKARAAAVKDVLINIYKISADRLTTDGKGETQPVGDNKTTDGKAQNRRVEFVKI